MSSVKVGILGHGTIGGGVSRILLSDSDSLQQKSIGKELELTAIATKDPKTDEEFYKSHTHLFREADEILSDPEISIICETIGGNTIALEFVKKALQNGKHVVTANKKMIARHFCELNEIAKKNNVSLLYESAVGGGIPILSTITNGLAGDKTQKTEGILNGTTNFILSEMERTGADFGEVLKAAQNLGYAESDPTDDIEGFDAAYKLCILIALGFNTYISPDAIPTRGISELCASDFDYAAILGKRIKLIATAEKNQNGIFAEVCPMLVSRETRIAKTDGVLNAIHIRGKYNTEGNFLSGEGAGRFPTAAAIVSDMMMIANECSPTVTQPKNTPPSPAPRRSWYLRFLVNDKPGIIGEIGTIFGKHNICIDSVHQVDHQKSPAHFMLTTMPSQDEVFQKALAEISQLKCNAKPPFVMPIREKTS